MTVYDPNPTVTINGAEYTSNVINNITISAGRSNIDEQPRAGYAQIRLVNYIGIPPIIKLNDPVHISVSNSAGVDPRLFAGYVTDIGRRIIANGNKGIVSEVIVQAVGPLARLARFATEATYPKEYDGDRIARMLQSVYTTSWNEVDPALTWTTVDPTKTWITYDPGYVGTIDTPGDYGLVAYDGGITSVQAHANNVAKSALGVLYETPEGVINYDSGSARIDRATAGVLEIDANYTTGLGLETTSSIGDLVNDIVVTYKNGAQTQASDLASINKYGLFAAEVSTLLEQQTAAEQQRDHYLATRAWESLSVGSISLHLHNPDLPDALRDALLGVFCGFPIAVPNFPVQLLATGFTGFVEGYRWEITNKTATLTMNVSDYGMNAVTQAWVQVNPALTWDTMATTITWNDARLIY